MTPQTGKLSGSCSHGIHETYPDENASPTAGLPLEAASRRLRKPAGRPRKDSPGDSQPERPAQPFDLTSILGDRAPATLALAPTERPGITARRLYSRRQAADYLSCSVDTVDRLVARGLLPKLYLPHSRLVRFDFKDLEHIVAMAKAATAGWDRGA
jgi:excisionase family DNA binding protein